MLIFDDDIVGAGEVDFKKDVGEKFVLNDEIVDEFDITGFLVSLLLGLLDGQLDTLF